MQLPFYLHIITFAVSIGWFIVTIMKMKSGGGKIRRFEKQLLWMYVSFIAYTSSMIMTDMGYSEFAIPKAIIFLAFAIVAVPWSNWAYDMIKKIL